MQKAAYWSFSFAIVGAVGVTAITLLQYISIHREHRPGSYFPVFFGALIVGLVAMFSSYFASPTSERSVLQAVIAGLLSAIAFFGILTVVLILGFGT